MVRRSVADDSYGRGPFARSIELGEVQTLPCPEFDRTVAYRERHAVTDEDRFDMSRSVPFGVRVRGIARNHSLERREDVFLHIGVRVLVYEDGRGRVRDTHTDQPVTYFRARDRRLHARGDIDRLLVLVRFDGDLFVPDGHARTAASFCAAILAMRAAVALPPLTTRTVLRPRGSTFRARTAASGAASDGSTRSESASRYSYEARS